MRWLSIIGYQKRNTVIKVNAVMSEQITKQNAGIQNFSYNGISCWHFKISLFY